MPPLPSTPQALRLRFVGSRAGKNWANVLHCSYISSLPVPADLNTLAASLAGLWNTRFAPQVDTGTTLTLTDLQDLSSATGAYGSSNIGHAGTGSAGSGNIANSVSAAVSWKISYHYRGGHPRTYLCGVPALAINDPRTLTSTYATALAAAMNGFITDVAALTSPSTGSLTLGMVSYYQHKALRPAGVYFPFSSAVVHPRLDSQRRRLGKEVI